MTGSGDMMNMILGGAMSESGQHAALLACNEFTRQYGLTLTAEDAAMLTETRREALRTAGRVEFTGGAVEKIVTEFAASPYITQASFAATLAALTERECETVGLMAQRLSNREIAERLYLSEGSVKQYVKQIYSKLHIEGDTRTKRSRLSELLAEKN